MKLSTTQVYTSHSYTLPVSERITVGALARYLAHYEAHIHASTLEVARPARNAQRLHDLDLQTGDRLVIFTQPPQPAKPPERLSPGDKLLKFSAGDFVITSRGKKGLLVGKPDDALEVLPDVDLRYVVAPGALEAVSRGCLWLAFDETEKRWYASRLGQTLVMLDEYELRADKIPLDGSHWLRFFRAGDSPSPIGELRVQVETVQTQDALPTLEIGSYFLPVVIGTERASQTLNASPNIPVGQVATSLAIYNHTPLTVETRLYLLRLIAPDSPIASLGLRAEDFLYTSRHLYQARTVLLLRDVHRPERLYTLPAGMGDEDKVIGCRTEGAPLPDVDLYDNLEERGKNPALYTSLARLTYRALDNGWWLRLDEQAMVGVFVNNVRATSVTPIRLIPGDVLTIGQSLTDYSVRLEVALAARKG